jgi:hypothetical protein
MEDLTELFYNCAAFHEEKQARHAQTVRFKQKESHRHKDRRTKKSWQLPLDGANHNFRDTLPAAYNDSFT